MSVVKEERDRLDNVLRRYMATGTVDAILAGAEAGWAAITARAWSPASAHAALLSTRRAEPRRSSMPVHVRSTTAVPHPERDGSPAPAHLSEVTRFRLLEDRSVALVEARSTVGPITFGCIGITGTIDAAVRDGEIVVDEPTRARLEIDVGGLRSGNALYDAELLRRIDARRYPSVVLELDGCSATASADRFRLTGVMTFHGVSRPISGAVTASIHDRHRLFVDGEEMVDVRDFRLALPTVLMLRIYPDVRVQLHVEAEQEG
jgi:hypothetical protein